MSNLKLITNWTKNELSEKERKRVRRITERNKKPGNVKGRKIYWCAKVDFDTHDIVIKKTKVLPSIAAQYTHIPYPATGYIYAPSESELLDQIVDLYEMRIKKAVAMLNTLNDKDGIPAEYIPHQNGTAKHIDLDDEKAAR